MPEKKPKKPHPNKIIETEEQIKEFWDMYDNGDRDGNKLSAKECCWRMGWSWNTIQVREWYSVGIRERKEGRSSSMTFEDMQGILSEWLKDVEEGTGTPSKEAIQLLIGGMNAMSKRKDTPKKIPKIEIKAKGKIKCVCGRMISLGEI